MQYVAGLLFLMGGNVFRILHKKHSPVSPQRGAKSFVYTKLVEGWIRGDDDTVFFLPYRQGPAASSLSAHVWLVSTLSCLAILDTCLEYQRTSVTAMAGPCFVHGVDWA